MHRNISILNYLILNYPDKKWNIKNIIYGLDFLLNQINFNKSYLFFPIYLYLFQLNQSEKFNYYHHNSLFWSINSLDLDWITLINSIYFNTKIFLDNYLSSNKFSDFIHQHIDQKNLFELISNSNNLDLNLVIKNNKLPWNWNILSQNSSINYLWLEVFKNKDWNIDNLLNNTSFSLSWINFMNDKLLLGIDQKNKYLILNSKYFDIFWVNSFNLDLKLIWRSVCRHQNFKIEWLSYFSENIFDWNNIIINNNFNLKWLKLMKFKNIYFNNLIKSKYFHIKLLFKYKIVNIDYDLILKHNNFKIDWLKIIPSKYSDFKIISKSDNLSVSWIKKYPNETWDYKYIYNSINIQPFYDIEMIEYLLNLSHKDEYFKQFKNQLFANKLSMNSGFNIKWVYLFPSINWNFNLISQHPNLSLSWIQENFSLPWNFFLIAKHKNIFPDDFITLLINIINDDMIDNKVYDLYWFNLSLNPNLSLSFIKHYEKYLYFDQLSLNNFNGIYYQNIIKKNIKNQIIKVFEEELIQKTWHPSRVIDWCFEYDFNWIS